MAFPNFPFPLGSSRNPSTGDAVITLLSATVAQAKPQVPQSGLLLLKHNFQHKRWLNLFSLDVWIPVGGNFICELQGGECSESTQGNQTLGEKAVMKQTQ